MSKKQEWNGNCICGHSHSDHGPSGSINYSAGRCSRCNCLHFIHNRESSTSAPEPEIDLIGNDPLSWAIQELMGLSDKFVRQIYTASRLFAAIRTKRDRSGGVCVCDRADQPKPERAEAENYMHLVMCRKCNACGYSGEDLSFPCRHVTTRADVANISITVHTHCPRCHSENLGPLHWDRELTNEYKPPTVVSTPSPSPTPTALDGEEKEVPADILEWIDKNSPYAGYFEVSEAYRDGAVAMWKKLQGEIKELQGEIAYVRHGAREMQKFLTDQLRELEADSIASNERIASLTKELDKADGIKLFHETKSSLKDAEISELSKQIASLTAERDEWKMAIAEAVCGQVQLDIGWQRMLDKYPQTKQA